MGILFFEVKEEADGGFVAECLTESIVTQGEDWPSLKTAVADAVSVFFFDDPEKAASTIHYVA